MFSGAASAPSVWQALYDSHRRLAVAGAVRGLRAALCLPHPRHLPPGMIGLFIRHSADGGRPDGHRVDARRCAPDWRRRSCTCCSTRRAKCMVRRATSEKPREFPNTEPVDLPVSADANRHHRFGPSLLNRALPFWAATLVERPIVIVVPLLVVLVPLINLLPQLVRWRFDRASTAGTENCVARTRTSPVAPASCRYGAGSADLDRIQRSVEQLRTPAPLRERELHVARAHRSGAPGGARQRPGPASTRLLPAAPDGQRQ